MKTGPSWISRWMAMPSTLAFFGHHLDHFGDESLDVEILDRILAFAAETQNRVGDLRAACDLERNLADRIFEILQVFGFRQLAGGLEVRDDGFRSGACSLFMTCSGLLIS